MQTGTGVNFYSLLFVAHGERHANLEAAEDAVEIYLRCGALLQQSMAAFGLDHTVLTNDLDTLQFLSASKSIPIRMQGFKFDRSVPHGIGFRAAHNKLDVLRAFGEGAFGDRVCLCDLDMVMLNPLPPDLETAQQLLGYDISDQTTVPYGAENVSSAFSTLGVPPLNHPPVWWGGEFLAGQAEHFKMLSRTVEGIYPRYAAAAPSLFHQGDEMVVSAALAILETQQNSAPIADARLVSRWWSARTLSRGPALSKAMRSGLLHLPADKDILAKLQRNGVGASELKGALWHDLIRKTRSRRWLNPLLNALRKEKKFAPEL